MKILNRYIKRSLNRRNKRKIVTLTYAIGVAVAFIISVINNSDVSASVYYKDNFDHLLFENSISDSVTIADETYTDSSVSNIKSLFEAIYFSDKDKNKTVEVKVQSGDNIIKILNNLGMDRDEANDVAASLKKVYDLRSLKAGQTIVFDTVIDPRTDDFLSMKNMTIPARAGERFIVEKSDKDLYVSRAEKDDLINEVSSATGTIEGTLSHSMARQGVPNKLVSDFINVFSYSVDFRRDVHKGDKFEIVYENYINENGDLIKTGNILYAALLLRKDRIALYRFNDPKGGVDYFDEKGYAMKKTLHRKPLAYQSARISSPFGLRRHPILKDKRIHWGVDYAAPRGTPIFAAGDGVIAESGYKGGYGNYIKIKHNSEYSTAYGHMNGYAKGMRAGVRVKQGQTIGYVGNTGRSTGPHLHYEVIQAGRRVNPTTIKASASENLTGESLRKFNKVVASIKESHKSMFASNKADEKVAKK